MVSRSVAFGIAALALVHLMEVRNADARVLAIRTEAAVTLADARAEAAEENADLRSRATHPLGR